MFGLQILIKKYRMKHSSLINTIFQSTKDRFARENTYCFSKITVHVSESLNNFQIGKYLL
jgi:hypothetical protein